MALVKASLTRKPAPPLDALEQHPAPTLAELAEEERAAVSKRYRDLVQIETGSLRGNPEADEELSNPVDWVIRPRSVGCSIGRAVRPVCRW